MKILHYKDEPIYRETFSKKELKNFLGGMGIYWDGDLAPIIEKDNDPKYNPDEISVDVTKGDFIIYNMEYTTKGFNVIRPNNPAKKEFEKYDELKFVVSKSGMFMIYSPDEKMVLDLSKNWMEYNLIKHANYECGKILRNAELNKERELANPKLTNEERAVIEKRYDEVLENVNQIVKLASQVRMTYGRRGVEDEYRDQILDKRQNPSIR